jgi:dual specificity tyrosine-phosphorylation-regulated kinase 2/3/4
MAALIPKKPSMPPPLVLPTVFPGGASTSRSRLTPKEVPPVVQTARVAATELNGMDCEAAVSRHGTCLSDFERDEICNFGVVYYLGQNCENKIKAPVPGGVNSGFDDERGDYTVVMKDHINYRYEVLSTLGRGSFGQVVKTYDHRTGNHVAVKIIRNKKRFHQQAEVEIKVLCHLRDRDPEAKYGIIRLIDHFTFRSHVCLTYELLSINLYEHMKMTKFYPMPLPVVKKIGASILISLAFMWRENIIHCDLKPENILLRQPNRTAVKVIDLGSACFENERIYTYIQSRFYRAPEIILGTPYTRKIDLWSFACVLCELASGYPLFPGENETEQLACIMEVLGVPPKHVLDSSPRRGQFFDLSSPDCPPKLVPNSRKKVRQPSTKSLSAFVGVDDDDPFIEFVRLFLNWDPEERPPPEAAMRHRWICDAYVGITPKMPIAKKSSEASSRRKSDASDKVSGVPTLPNINSKKQ